MKGLISLVVFAEGADVLGAFDDTLRKHRYSNLKSFFLNYHSHGDWLGVILSRCLELDAEEVKVRVHACKTGGVATAICLIGSRKQVFLFPSKYELVCALMKERIGGRREKKEGGTKSTVGQRLGTTLGYETDSSEEDEKGSSEEDEKENGHFATSSYMQHQVNDESGGVECDRGALVHQVVCGFGNWLERLADGSLRRYRMQEWPDWTVGT